RNGYPGNQSSIAPKVNSMGGRQRSARQRRLSERIRAMTVIAVVGVDADAVDDATNRPRVPHRPSLVRKQKSSGHPRVISQLFYQASPFLNTGTVGLPPSLRRVKAILAAQVQKMLNRASRKHTLSCQRNFLRTSRYLRRTLRTLRPTFRRRRIANSTRSRFHKMTT